MNVKTEYKGYVLELQRSLGGIRFVVNGEIRGMSGGKLVAHKIDQSFEAELLEGMYQGEILRAELKLGWVFDRVLFYHGDKLICEKKIF